MSGEEMIALKDVKDRLSSVVDHVQREHDRVVITKHGRPAAVMMSVDDLESLEETLNVVSSPSLVQQIGESLDELGARPARVLTKGEALALSRAE